MQATTGSFVEAPVRYFSDRLTDLCFDDSSGILPFLLKFGDGLSMACSLESRLPFLDHRLVEFVSRLPPLYKLKGALSKPILKEAMTDIVPQQILSRRDKVGFHTPYAHWIGQSIDSGLKPLLLSERCRSALKHPSREITQLVERGFARSMTGR